ncbi:MAG: Ig-like domain-containing protein [Bacteroidales bacterium]|nr:Ig-like domain-containing protein [Bacteroidales bacterium]
MKKIFARYFIILTALTVLVGPSCMREDDLYSFNEAVKANDGKVSLDGTLELPFSQDQGDWVATKGAKMGEDTPTVKFLYLAVFSAGDILYEIVKAKPGTQSHPTAEEAGFNCGTAAENYLTKFHVDNLTKVSSGDRYIHFIATTKAVAEFENMEMNLVDEATFVRALTTTNAGLAYWGRRHFSSLTETTDMTGIKMIRNFAKVKVKVDDSVTNFQILNFKVFNTPVYGTIAPFNTNTEDYQIVDGVLQVNFNRFANFELATEQPAPYTWLTNTDMYHGFMPPVIQYNAWSSYYSSDGTDTMDANNMWIDPAEADYLYECSYRPDANPFIILKARLNESGAWHTYYYKADFVYKDADTGDNVYYNILRNFCYTLNITGVNGKGSDSVYDAFNSIALNNFEGSTMAQELTNIANDNSRLYVSKTDILVTFGTSFTMYVRSGTGTNFLTDDNASITAEIRDATSGNNIVSSSSNITISDTNVSSGVYSGWREVTIKCANPESLQPGEVWKQPIVFKNGDGLTRTVNLTLRRPFSLSVDVQDFVDPVKGTEVWVDFNVPAGLTVARFPLYFYIEQEDNTMYPKPLAPGADETLTVENGPSLIPGRTKNNYYYRRSINWDEYTSTPTDVNGIKTFRSYFKTMVEQSATTVWVVAAPTNDFYYPVDDVNNSTNRDTFANIMEEGNLYFEYYGMQLQVNGTAVNRATSNASAPITYTSSDTSVATVDQDGKVTGVGVGTATITASADAYRNYTAADPVSYTVTVTDQNLSGLAVKWLHEPVFVVKVGSDVQTPGTYTLADGYTGTPVATYSSADNSIATVSSNGTVHGVSAGYVLITYTVEVPAGNGYAATTQSVHYEIQVVTNKAASGTVHHEETFLANNMGDYQIIQEKVTDGETYQTGNDRTADFIRLTWFSAGLCYRHLWYPYYNVGTGLSYGVTQSAWGAIEEPTNRWNTTTSTWETDYHNARFAAFSKISSKDIDLSCSAGATITFYHAGNYFDDPANPDARANMRADAKMRFSKNGGQTWSDPVNINYPPGTNWIYIKAQAEIPSDYLVSNFRVSFECESHPDHYGPLYYTSASSNETTTTNTGYPVYYEVVTVGAEERVCTTYTHTNTGHPVTVSLDDGRAGTWEIKNLTITEN